MITLEQYVGVHKNSPDWTHERKHNAIKLLDACNKLILLYEGDGNKLPTNPATASFISGKTLGGFRPQNSTVGASKSKHKEGKAVDIFDPLNRLDEWCMANLDSLEECSIYIEHPSATNTWSHWQNVPPLSKKRVFYP